MDNRYRVHSPESLLSPSLIIFREIVRHNIRTAIEIAGSPDRLRLHAKTHKMPEMARLEREYGVRKHKCATIAEAEMLARAGAEDVLVAYPLVGPNPRRLAALMTAYPKTTFRTLVDSIEGVESLSAAISNSAQKPLAVLIDLDVGMGRTGVAPERAMDLVDAVRKRDELKLDGVQAYDGHLKQPDPKERAAAAAGGIRQAIALHNAIGGRLVMGGTPTFPIHAALEQPNLECSPGTCVFHDASYMKTFPDLPFVPAALVFTRVISRPRPGRLCLDVGHKAVAADPPVASRLTLVDIPDASIMGQSEEHLVVDTQRAGDFPPGTPVLAIPAHVCPTVALHRWAYVVDDGNVVDQWEVTARDRVLSA